MSAEQVPADRLGEVVEEFREAVSSFGPGYLAHVEQRGTAVTNYLLDEEGIDLNDPEVARIAAAIGTLFTKAAFGHQELCPGCGACSKDLLSLIGYETVKMTTALGAALAVKHQGRE